MIRSLLEIARALVAWLVKMDMAREAKAREKRNAEIYEAPGDFADDFFSGGVRHKASAKDSTTSAKADADGPSK